MGMADSDRDGGSGNTGGRGGSSSGGSSSGGGRGNNTPGPRDGNGRGRTDNAGPDGRGNNTPGPRDGNGRGRTNSGGKDTPGSPDNPGRRGDHSIGSTAASRARDAMSRHARERNERAAQNGDFDLVASLQEAEQEGTMTPRQRDMAIGMEAGMESKGFMDTVGATINRGITGLTGLLGLGKVGESAVSAGVNAASAPSNPESQYGAQVARSRMDNTMMQDAAEMGAGLLMGPAAGMTVGTINNMANLNANKDIAALNADIDAREAASRSGRRSQADGGSSSRAVSAMRPSAPAPQKAQPFSWSPVDINQYRRGLLSLAQRS